MEGFNRRPSFGGNRGGGRFGGGRGGGFRHGGGFNRGPREMHKATCSECKKECEVPFKPTEGKPVYCKECYFKKKDAGFTPRAPKAQETEQADEAGDVSEEQYNDGE